jgi:carboxypeptidase C (cathepsin A)
MVNHMHRQILLLLTLTMAFAAWGQGGRAGRGTAAQQAAPAANPAGNAAGRGGAPAINSGTGDFYNYDTTASGGPAIPDAPPVETHQKMAANGESIAYTARAGYLPLRNATTGQPEAHLFFTSYTKDGVSADVPRPLVFFCGGAPGVAAAWQEFGGLGPKRMKWTSDAIGPYTWVDNPHSLLPEADLVFVNPVGTAFSRPDQPARGPNFWTTAADIASLAEFVRSFVVRYERANSHLYLAGEDFGTGRVAGLADYLNDHHIPVHGVVLLSMTAHPDAQAGDTHYITLLPSLIMAAWYQKKLSPELTTMSAEQISGQARQFASREYLHALYKGDRMTADERNRVLADLSRFTGLSKAFLISNDRRITLERFNGELLRDQHRALSGSDARVTGFLPLPAAAGRRGGGRGFAPPPPPVDYNLSAIAGGFETAYETYLRRELTFNSNNSGIFYLSSGGIGEFTSTGSDETSLANAFARNPKLRLFVSVNYFDLNSPFYATEYALAHLNVSPEVRSHNITVSHYDAGSMTYADDKALVKLHGDLARFVSEGAQTAAK